jgi:ComF family protein
LSVALAPACAACGDPLDRPTRGPVCEPCWRAIAPAAPIWHSRDVEAAGAAGLYDGALKAIVHALKYDGRRSLARPLAALIRARCPAVLAGAHCVVPVPLHRARRLRRGFNQAADLAQHVGLPLCRALRRTRDTATQTGLAAAERHANVRGAFAPTRAGGAVVDAVVVLVDDVCTTGATLDACARALRQAGAREVRAVAAARAVR